MGRPTRREFLAKLGVGVAATAGVSGAGIGVAGIAHAQEKPKGIIPSGNTPALGPVAEELKLLTIFVDGCTDFLFDKAVPNPHYVFRITNIQSADGATCALAVATTWPDVKKVAHIHPDYSYGRNCYDHFSIVTKKLLPHASNVSEGWPKLGTTDFASHIT